MTTSPENPSAATSGLTAQCQQYKAAAENVRELLLADLIHICEIPAPTGGEEPRIRFMANRFAEIGLADIAIDTEGNGTATIPGREGRRNLLVLTNADTLVKEPKDRTVDVRADRLVGPFVGDNSIALATLTTLPLLLEKLNLTFKANIVLLASTRSLGRGNLQGLKHFLTTVGRSFAAGLCLESVQLGRLNYHCMGLLLGDVWCRLPENYNWSQYGATGSIIPMSDIISRISQISLPRRPLSTIVLGMIRGGITANNIARETVLSFEARSESQEILKAIKQQLSDIIAEVGARSGVNITLDVIAQREPGGLDIGHPLVRRASEVLTALGLQPMLYSTTSQLSALRDAKIPGLTVGLTLGERRYELDEIDESVTINPLTTGLAQVVAILQAMDEDEAQ
ncbi:MAG: peptidase dimerization domain-containing protein [Lentisphaerae bacterium]|nr:peptidase dimerization domain-containing protein [Lentisphaerota bacterium]